jgi:predicted alpha/beta-hydrolase family hydrolase
MTTYAYQGPKRGADRAVLLAHGAGADLNAAALTTTADALAKAKIPSLRFNFPYRDKGRGGPDRPPVLEAAVREAIGELSKLSKVPPERCVLGGRSMGGRICSMVGATDGALGLVLLGYPLHPPGKPENLRVEHFPKLKMPVLFVSGTRDTFATPDELKGAAKKIRGKVTYSWIDTGDHGFKPLKSSGLTVASVLADVSETVVGFVQSLPVPA